MSRVEFTAKTKALAFGQCSGRCVSCGVRLQAGKINYDHRIPCALGGDNSLENCDVLCKPCHDVKTHGTDVPTIAKAVRQYRAHIGAKVSATPMPYGKGSKFKRKINGKVVPREQD